MAGIRKLHIVNKVFWRLMLAAAFAACIYSTAAAQSAEDTAEPSSIFRVGEKLSYNVSYSNLDNVAFLEFQVVSDGRLQGRRAVELRSRSKTFDIVSAAFAMIDESRIVYAAPDTGLPLYIKSTNDAVVIPSERITNNLNIAEPPLDLVTLVYRLRAAAGIGTFIFSENGQTYTLTAQPSGSEKISTDSGDFDAAISLIQSTFFDELGVKDLRVGFSTDERHLPVLIRFNTSKGPFTAKLSGLVEPVPAAVKPTPTPAATPVPRPTPKPIPTPTPYIRNQPLLSELAFLLGEKLEYKIGLGGRYVADMTMQARERTLFNGRDSLLLIAEINAAAADQKALQKGDMMSTRVNPDTLVPFNFDIKAGGSMASLTQSLTFDAQTGSVSYGGGKADVPVGTHDMLSLLYAMRSFNLKRSKDSTNPVNDTRVAVFWIDKPYIFRLMPGDAETITIGGQKVLAQSVTVNTGNPQIDVFGIKVWLSLDSSRVPLRVNIGQYQADLVIKDASLYK